MGMVPSLHSLYSCRGVAGVTGFVVYEWAELVGLVRLVCRFRNGKVYLPGFESTFS